MFGVYRKHVGGHQPPLMRRSFKRGGKIKNGFGIKTKGKEEVGGYVKGSWRWRPPFFNGKYTYE